VPDFITLGPDGALWFTEFEIGKIGRGLETYPPSGRSKAQTPIDQECGGPEIASW
jgi:streptogramin lyase